MLQNVLLEPFLSLNADGTETEIFAAVSGEEFQRFKMTKRVNSGLSASFCLLTTFIEYGMIFSFGAILIELLDKYQTDRATAATVPSLLVGVTTCFVIVPRRCPSVLVSIVYVLTRAGVVSGALITKIGLTWVLLISCVLVPIGFSVSSFVTSIEHLYVSIGIVSGVGISLGYISALTIIGRIFKGKQRIQFLAVQSAFISLSGLAYPYFLDWLIELYGLNGTFLVLGAIYSNKLPCFIICWMNRASLNVSISDLSSREVSNHANNSESDATQSPTRHRRNFILGGVNKLRMIVNRTYLMLLFASATSVAIINAYLAILLDFGKWKGYSVSQGLFTFSIFNIADLLQVHSQEKRASILSYAQ